MRAFIICIWKEALEKVSVVCFACVFFAFVLEKVLNFYVGFYFVRLLLASFSIILCVADVVVLVGVAVVGAECAWMYVCMYVFVCVIMLLLLFCISLYVDFQMK